MYLYLIAVLLLIAVIFVWGRRDQYAFLRDWLPTRSADGVVDTDHSSPLAWQPIDETAQGFHVDLPGNPTQTAVPANSEVGSNEPIKMILVKTDASHTFAVAWADKPPVARVNDLIPDKTLDQARDGALARTSTTLVSESRSSPQGYPGRDLVAHNAGGGILDARFIFTGIRLYMLIATAPSAAGRHEQDVNHFFNSFAVASDTQIPETLPPAKQ
jgi:hypothetical protein